MEIIQMHYFCMVARYHSMSRAAEELWVSQSALSKAISSLEEELELKLFDRVGRRLTLNDAGQAYYKRMCGVLVQLKSAQTEVCDRFSRAENEVRLIISAGNYVYNWLGEHYRKAHPDSELYIRVSYDPDIYELSQCDFHLFASPKSYPGMECLPLMEERLLLAMNENHPLAGRDVVHLAEAEPYWFQCLQPTENLRENMFQFCAQAGFTPKISFCTNDSYSFFNALSGSSDNLAFLPERTLPPSALDNIIFKPIAGPPCARTLYLGWDKNRYMPRCYQQFIPFCQSFFTRENLDLLLIRKH